MYRQIDIGLDPFPYNGITTTCDALWMGVPVLTFPGERPASRAGLSILSNIGLTDLIANSADEYVQLAQRMCADPARLATLRRSLRGRMQASPMMDAARFARNMETAYRQMWRGWCTG
jgi:predicted O-linked N-acetylglucosamine transferase (SPINDLY family)